MSVTTDRVITTRKKEEKMFEKSEKSLIVIASVLTAIVFAFGIAILVVTLNAIA